MCILYTLPSLSLSLFLSLFLSFFLSFFLILNSYAYAIKCLKIFPTSERVLFSRK